MKHFSALAFLGAKKNTGISHIRPFENYIHFLTPLRVLFFKAIARLA
jgi:hypothetical protein